MAVTLQQIADAAGVSRGTVDRALKNKGRIKPETAERVKKLAEEMGYIPSRAGRALAMAKRNIKIGVIIEPSQTEFIREMLKGVEAAKKEVESLEGTVDIFTIDGTDAQKEIEIMYRLRNEQYSGIAMVPAEDLVLRGLIDEFSEKNGIPIVTFNSDLEGTRRLCYIGQNAIQSGKTAAGLMGDLLSGKGQVAVISAFKSAPTVSNRVSGFIKELRTDYPGVDIIGVRYCYEDDWVAEKITDEILDSHPNLSGIYLSASGVNGVCRVLEKYSKQNQVRVIANDLVEGNIYWLKRGTINFLIGQNAWIQGYDPVMTLFRLFMDGKKPEKEFQYTDIVIKTKYNI
ncbi:MAG: LacI family DNA-binding transcriptional regulator [Bilifractor sp.]